MLSFKNFNIADWFSFYRIIAAPFLLVLVWYDVRLIFTWLLFVSYSTDAIDGYLARKFKITSSRGSQLDSIGDQMTLVVGLIALFYFENEFIVSHTVLLLIAFVPYAIQMFISYYKYGRATSFHTYLAKLAAMIQSLFIIWSLFFSPEPILFYILVGIAILETIEEITLIYMYNEWVSDVKGIYWAFRDRRRLKSKL